MTVCEPEDGASTEGVIEEFVAKSRGRHATRLPGTLLGEVTDDRHPSLLGRVRVRLLSERVWGERWLPSLMGLSLRKGDRVLLLQADNFDEPVVAGVLDGFRDRPEVEHRTGVGLELKNDETVRIAAEDGTGLVEVFRGEKGPVVRLLAQDVDLEFPGKLRISAQDIELKARRGMIKVEASDDVVVRGEVIHFN